MLGYKCGRFASRTYTTFLSDAKFTIVYSKIRFVIARGFSSIETAIIYYNILLLLLLRVYNNILLLNLCYTVKVSRRDLRGLTPTYIYIYIVEMSESQFSTLGHPRDVYKFIFHILANYEIEKSQYLSLNFNDAEIRYIIILNRKKLHILQIRIVKYLRNTSRIAKNI